MLIETICGIDRAHIAFPDASEAYPVLLQAPRPRQGRSAVDIAKRVSSEHDQTFRCTIFHYTYTSAASPRRGARCPRGGLRAHGMPTACIFARSRAIVRKNIAATSPSVTEPIVRRLFARILWKRATPAPSPRSSRYRNRYRTLGN